MDHQGGYGTIVGSHPEDSKIIKVDGYFDARHKNPTYATLGQIIHAKQRKYSSISQLPENFVHHPELVGYDSDQGDDIDNTGYNEGSSSQIVQTARREKYLTMAANVPTDRIIRGGLRGLNKSTALGGVNGGKP